MENRTFIQDFQQPYLWQRILLWILVFIQFYPVNFIFLPVSSRVIISILGLSLLGYKILSNIFHTHTIYLKRILFLLFIPLFGMTIFSIVSMNYNGTNDNTFLYYFTTPLLMLSSSYLIYEYGQKVYKGKFDFAKISYYCIGVVVIQLILGISMYFNTSFRDSLLKLTKEGLRQLNRKEAGRFMGFGAFFMNLGVANGVGMMLIALLLKNSDTYRLGKGTIRLLSFLLIAIAILGNFQARTTTICSIIAILFLSFSSIKFNARLLKKGFFRVFVIVLCGFFLIFSLFALFPEFVESQSSTIDYGFELFTSYNSGKGLQTTSSNTLSRMLHVWPTSDKTWFIGDGLYTINESDFYMNTDVGYARLIFYFGIFGMLFFYIYEIWLLWISFRNSNKLYVSFFIYFLIMFLFINLKSFTEYSHYVGLFFMLNILSNRENNRKLNKTAPI